MSKEHTAYYERIEFISRESPRDKDYHRDTYRVMQIDHRTKQVIWIGQRIYTVFKRINKTVVDKRTGAYFHRFHNRRTDPNRAPRSG